MPSSEQQVEQHAQRINIRGYGDGLALQLLGSSVLGRQRGSTDGKGCLLFRVVLGLDQLGYSEVQQLYVAVLTHQHVRRFEVAMHNQVGVGRCHRIEYLKKKVDARVEDQAGADRSSGRSGRRRHIRAQDRVALWG